MKRVAILLAVPALMALPSAAHAAAVSVGPNPASGGKRVLFRAGPGEINQLYVDLQGSVYTLQDLGSPPMTEEPPCARWQDENRMVSGSAATCPAQGIDALDIRLGADNDYVGVGGISHVPVATLLAGGPGNDRFFGSEASDRIFGEGGNDTLRGREGRDQLVGGPGDDSIDAVDGAIDEVWCGEGYDTVSADENDAIAADCEEVNGAARATGPVTDEPALPPSDEPVVVPTITQEIELTTLDDALEDGLTVRAGCSSTCTITSELRVSQRLKRRLGLRSVVVGRSSSGSAKASRPRRMRVRFGKRARRVLRRQQTVSLTLRIDAVDVDGNPFAAETKLRLRRDAGG